MILIYNKLTDCFTTAHNDGLNIPKSIKKQKRKLLIWLRKLLKGRRKGLIRESLKRRLIKLFMGFMV